MNSMKLMQKLLQVLCLAVWTLNAAPVVFAAECKLSESRRKFEGAEHTIITLENARILVEIAPSWKAASCGLSTRPGPLRRWNGSTIVRTTTLAAGKASRSRIASMLGGRKRQPSR